MNEFPEDESLLLALLNTTPVDRGTETDQLGDDEAAATWLKSQGGAGSPTEIAHTRSARDALQEIVRDGSDPAPLSRHLEGVALVPATHSGRLEWELQAPADREIAVRAVITWHQIEESLPGRLRPCGNEECHRFLIDHSRGNRAQWCSMAVCGNRMKARRHYQRTRESHAQDSSAKPLD